MLQSYRLNGNYEQLRGKNAHMSPGSGFTSAEIKMLDCNCFYSSGLFISPSSCLLVSFLFSAVYVKYIYMFLSCHMQFFVGSGLVTPPGPGLLQDLQGELKAAVGQVILS